VETLLEEMANLFQVDKDSLSFDTGPGDLPMWDSLGHVSLMAMIQQEFGTHIPVADALQIESISDLIKILDKYNVSTSRD